MRRGIPSTTASSHVDAMLPMHRRQLRVVVQSFPFEPLLLLPMLRDQMR